MNKTLHRTLLGVGLIALWGSIILAMTDGHAPLIWALRGLFVALTGTSIALLFRYIRQTPASTGRHR